MNNMRSTGRDTLLGKRVQIRLETADAEVYQRSGDQVPELPMVLGTFVKRFYFYGWGYVVELDKPLRLDCEGINSNARAKVSAAYLMAYYFSTDIYNGKDPIYLELTGKAQRVIKKGELHVILRYVIGPEEVPNEVGKNDEFLNENPSICWGWASLIQ